MSDASGKMKSFFKKTGAFLKKHALILMVVSLGLCLISGLFASMAHTSGYSVKIITETRSLTATDNGNNITNKFCFSIYKPKNATKSTPAPLVVLLHGSLNSKEMQSPAAIELSRRGFVVIALDYNGHGHSSYYSGTIPSQGAVHLVEYGSTLEYVDSDKIGLVGHSIAGSYICSAGLNYKNLGDAAFKDSLTAQGVTAATATQEQLDIARAADDKANKVRAVFQIGSMPPNSKSTGTKTSHGIIVTYYDESGYKQEGKYSGVNAAIPVTDLSRQNKFKYEWAGRDYMSSPAAANFMRFMYAGLPVYSRSTVPLEGERDYDPELTAPANNRSISIPETPIVEGGFYTSSGLMAEKPALGTAVTEPIYTLFPLNGGHATAFHNITALKQHIEFFYSTLGTPVDRSVIGTSNQTWVWKEVFTLIGLIGIILFIVEFAIFALKLPVFGKMKERKVTQPDGTITIAPFTRESLDEGLPALKGWKRHVPFWVTLLASSLITGFSLRYFTANNYGWGSNVFPSSTLFPQANVNNLVLVWAVMTGIISLALFTLQWLIFGRRLGDKPFEKLKTRPSNVARAWFGAFFVLAVAYLILVINQAIFGTDFRWYVISFKTFNKELFMTMLRYSFIFGLVFVMSAFINANLRFKNLPEWLSTTIVAFLSTFGLGLVFIIQYATVFSTGLYWWKDLASPMIKYGPLIIVLPLAAVMQRRIYLKSGSVWYAGFVTAMLFTIMFVANTNHTYSYVFF